MADPDRGADGWGEGRGVLLPTGALSIFFLILDVKMSTSSAFCALFLQFSYLLYTQETLLLGLENFLLHENKTAKGVKASLLETIRGL